jgi:hypothetical protein
MAEAIKQLFVGFIHPRTWLAALIGIVAAVITTVAISGYLTDFFTTILNNIGGYPVLASYLQSTGVVVFAGMIFVYSFASVGTYMPLLVLIVGASVAGLVFGFMSKKERVASKSIVGGFDIGIIYAVIVVVVYVFWTISYVGLTDLYNHVVALLQYAPIDILVSFLIFWWVSAIVSMIVLSLKHD